MSISTKKPLALTLTRLISSSLADGDQLAGQAWPVSVLSVDGAIVTVVFEVDSEFTLPQVTCPIAESRYVRLPVQEGDKGMVMAATARLGGVTGLGSGLAPLVAPSNLGALVYVPLGNKAWPTIDPNAVVIQAPNGSKILTDDGASEIIIDPNQVKVIQGSTTVTITGGVVTVDAEHVVINATDSTVNGDLLVNGDSTFTGDVTIVGDTLATGAFAIVGELTVTGGIALAGNFVLTGGTMIVNGKNIGSHVHTGGTLTGGLTGTNT